MFRKRASVTFCPLEMARGLSLSLTDLFLRAFIFLTLHTLCQALVNYGWMVVRRGRLVDDIGEAGRVFS